MNNENTETVNPEAGSSKAVSLPAETMLQLAEISKTEFWLITAETEFKELPDVTTTDGMKLAKTRRSECVSARTGGDAARKAATLPLRNEVSRINDLWSKDYNPRILALESPLDAAIKAETTRKAEAKAAKAQAEKIRMDAIQERISAIKSAPSLALTAVDVDAALAKLAEVDLATFEESADSAKIHLDYAITTLNNQKQKLVEQAAEAERLEQQRKDQEAAAAAIEAERLKVKQEQEQVAADRKALDDEKLENQRIKDAAEAARVNAHTVNLEAIRALPSQCNTVAFCDVETARLTDFDSSSFEEFANDASIAASNALQAIALKRGVLATTDAMPARKEPMQSRVAAKPSASVDDESLLSWFDSIADMPLTYSEEGISKAASIASKLASIESLVNRSKAKAA